MLSINKKKYLKSLNIKKNRLSENKILIEGLRIIEEAMNAKIKFDHIWLSKKYDNGTHKISDFIKKINNNNISFTFEKDKDMESISNTKNSQGLLGLIDISHFFNINLTFFCLAIIAE